MTLVLLSIHDGQPTRRGDKPLPPAAQGQSGRLVPVGRRGVLQSTGRRQAGPPVGRIRRVPLVSRDGARIVRGSRDRKAHERIVRLDQGRSRGAARHRRHLHDRRPSDDGPGGLADDDVPHSRRRSILRRHLLPERRSPWDAFVQEATDLDRRGLEGAPRRGPRTGPEAHRPHQGARCSRPGGRGNRPRPSSSE